MRRLFKLFQNNGYQLYLVGGVVRDAALQGDPDEDMLSNVEWLVREGKAKDLDFATDATPEETFRVLQQLHTPVKETGVNALGDTVSVYSPHPLGPYYVGQKFGTVGFKYFDYLTPCEVTTFRTDKYTPGSRKPEVKWGKTIEEDLLRRDFTVNSMAVDWEGTLIDPFDGRRSIAERVLRTSRNPEIVFREDPLRMLRAFRFLGRGYVLTGPVAQAIWTHNLRLTSLSGERIQEELTKILCSLDVILALQEMKDLGVLRIVLPSIDRMADFKGSQGEYHHKDVWGHTLQVVESVPRTPELRWAALFHDAGKPDTYSTSDTGVHFYGHERVSKYLWDEEAKRLRFSTDFREYVGYLVENHMQINQLAGDENVTDKSLRRLVKAASDFGIPWSVLQDQLTLSRADITSHNPVKVVDRVQRLAEFEHRLLSVPLEFPRALKLPKGTGSVVMEALGLTEGPEVGKLLKVLEQMLVDGELTPESDFAEAARKVAHPPT